MLITCCPNCGKAYTTFGSNLDAVKGNGNYCSHCGTSFRKVKRRRVREFRDKYLRNVWPMVEAFCRNSYIPDLQPEAFRRAFYGLLSWKDGCLLVEGHAGFQQSGRTIECYPPRAFLGGYRAAGNPAKSANITRRVGTIALWSRRYNAPTLYVCTRFEDAIRIRYYGTRAEGEPPHVMWLTRRHMRYRLELARFCHPKKVILIGPFGVYHYWNWAKHPISLWVPDLLPRPSYLVTRILEDTASNPGDTPTTDNGVPYLNTDRLYKLAAGLGVSLEAPSLAIPSWMPKQLKQLWDTPDARKAVQLSKAAAKRVRASRGPKDPRTRRSNFQRVGKLKDRSCIAH